MSKYNPPDKDIFVCEVADKPKRKSKTVHFAVKRDYETISFCRRRNARLFTLDWKKVTCHFCISDYQNLITTLIKEGNKRQAERERVREWALELNMVRKDGEKWRYWKERVSKVVENKGKEEELNIQKERYDNLSVIEFTLLPLEENKELEFPIEIPTTFDVNRDEEEYISIDKEKYIKLLKELEKLTKEQLGYLTNDEIKLKVDLSRTFGDDGDEIEYWKIIDYLQNVLKISLNEIQVDEICKLEYHTFDSAYYLIKSYSNIQKDNEVRS